MYEKKKKKNSNEQALFCLKESLTLLFYTPPHNLPPKKITRPHPTQLDSLNSPTTRRLLLREAVDPNLTKPSAYDSTDDAGDEDGGVGLVLLVGGSVDGGVELTEVRGKGA